MSRHEFIVGEPRHGVFAIVPALNEQLDGLLKDCAEHVSAELGFGKGRRTPFGAVHVLSLAVEQSSASVVITNAAGLIEYVNAKFTEVTGYSREEAYREEPSVLKSGEMPPEGYRLLWETITRGEQWRGEFHNKKKNGELYWNRR